MRKSMPIHDFLIGHSKLNPISFHMPGHKGSAIYKRLGYGEFLNNIMDCDITEIVGADNLFQTEGIIRESMKAYENLYDSRKSYLLINGTSGGIIAAILATVPKGKKIIMARNSHKSVFNALGLAQIQPLYAYPDMIEEYGISGAIPAVEIERLLKNNSDAEAVILPSPNYYGICSDIEAIAEIVHKYNKILIVDQAHGAHLKIFSKFGVKDLPKSAEESGADIVINSTHKTLTSFTQSAILNLNTDRVSSYIIEDKLQSIESTSPSYILMASLDINASILLQHGQKLMTEWANNLNIFYNEARKIGGMEYIDKVLGMDWTKINFSLGSIGISGDELEKTLYEKYRIFIELYTGDLVMCMTGIGNTRTDFTSLINALREIASERAGFRQKLKERTKNDSGHLWAYRKSELFEIPREKTRVPLLEAEGRICASSIIPYPPGIPLVCPGEKFEKEILYYIKSLREHGEKVIGIDSAGKVVVGDDKQITY